MMEIPDELLRKIVRAALLELGPETEAALLRKVVKEVIRRLPAPEREHTSFPLDLPPQSTTSQH